MILTNRQLAAIAATRPSSLSGLGAIDGIGPARLQRYGKAILRILGVPVLEVEAETSGGGWGTRRDQGAAPAGPCGGRARGRHPRVGRPGRRDLMTHG